MISTFPENTAGFFQIRAGEGFLNSGWIFRERGKPAVAPGIRAIVRIPSMTNSERSKKTSLQLFQDTQWNRKKSNCPRTFLTFPTIFKLFF